MPISLEQLRKEPSTPSLPNWVKSETTKKLYDMTIASYNDIKAKIDINTAPTDRTLIPRRIAIKCGLSPSIITERRQPDIKKLIIELNHDLSAHYKSSMAKKTTSGRKLTKEELLIENKRLKAENKELRQLTLSNFATAVLESSILSDARTYALTIEKLKEEIARQANVISNQAEQNRKYMDALSQ